MHLLRQISFINTKYIPQKMKALSNIGLNKKIFLIFISILFISLLTIWIFVYSYFEKLTSESLEHSVKTVMENHAKRVTDFFWRADTIGSLLNTETPSFYDEVQDATDIFVQYKLYQDLLKKFSAFCHSSLGQDISYRSFLLLPDEFPISKILEVPGNDLFQTDKFAPYSVRIISDRNVKNTQWFEITGTLEGDTYWFMHPEDFNTIWICTRLGDHFLLDNRVEYYSLGTLLIGIDISWIMEQFDDNALQNSAELFITDFNNRIIFSEDTSLVNRSFDDITSDMKKENSIYLRGVPCHLWKQDLPNNMLLYSCVPVQTIDAHMSHGLSVFLTLFLGVLCVGLGLTAFFSQLVTSPLRRLSTHMKNTTLPVPIEHHYHSTDEVSILYHTFNEMLDKIYTYSKEQQLLQYQLLQAQINPHFLYNTLDSVGCVALMHGERKLSDILSSLALLLRYNIHQPESLVSLSEELCMVDDYISIQQFRCDNMIHYTCQVPEDIKSTRLPKTIIQPIIENCIQYGIISADGQRHVKIKAAFTNHTEDSRKAVIDIQISNHVAMDTNTELLVNNLNQYLQGKAELTRKNSGLGIKNVQQRIKLTFGENYGIRYTYVDHEITAIISIPYFD